VRTQVTCVLCLCLLATVAAADTYVVDPDGTGDYPTIQDAIDAAVNGDIIELTSGTFTGDGNRDLSFGGKSITVRSQGGDPLQCVIDCQGSDLEWHTGFSFFSLETASSRLEGLTITGGYAQHGAGVSCTVGSSPTITGCVFSGNLAVRGGGLECDRSSPTITACLFTGNSSTVGGGIYCFGASSPVISDCRFYDNTADNGGGIYFDLCTPAVSHCTFSGNDAVLGGGAAYLYEGSISLTSCTFDQNSSGSGSAIQSRGSITLESSLIVNGSGSAAVTCVGTGSVTLSCCNVYGNGGGDWVDCITGQDGSLGNISAAPQFCADDPGGQKFWAIQSDSPCAPAQSSCGLIGAWDVGCNTTATVGRTWGGLKASYR
jgi:predicted outer membrane repeat protein